MKNVCGTSYWEQVKDKEVWKRWSRKPREKKWALNAGDYKPSSYFTRDHCSYGNQWSYTPQSHWSSIHHQLTEVFSGHNGCRTLIPPTFTHPVTNYRHTGPTSLVTTGVVKARTMESNADSLSWLSYKVHTRSCYILKWLFKGKGENKDHL